jgi:hypothetical protein
VISSVSIGFGQLHIDQNSLVIARLSGYTNTVTKRHVLRLTLARSESLGVRQRGIGGGDGLKA